VFLYCNYKIASTKVCCGFGDCFNLFSCCCDSRSPDLLRGTGKSIDGDLDVDDEGSEQRQFEPMQLLHHDSVGYQPMRTRIGLTKKAMSLQANREHKQEHERTIFNYR
jgi:hypothetical protein